jgi:hypothetical protein
MIRINISTVDFQATSKLTFSLHEKFIDVLTCYPMIEHQIHYGRKFYQDKKTGYWISTDYPRIRAHKWVWCNIKGAVPAGYHVHHKDGNKSNNSPENLEILEGRIHLSLHANELMSDPIRLEAQRKHAERIRALTKDWHRSKEGREWHKKHGILGWEKREEFEITCSQCGKKARTKVYHQAFCSNKCKAAARRASGIDNEERTCKICSKKFFVNKYSKQTRCGQDCLINIRNNLAPVAVDLRKKGYAYQDIAETLNMTRKQVSDLLKIHARQLDLFSINIAPT